LRLGRLIVNLFRLDGRFLPFRAFRLFGLRSAAFLAYGHETGDGRANEGARGKRGRGPEEHQREERKVQAQREE
jgi:hypothetical protein